MCNTAIIILNYNGEDDTKECLESINKFYSKLKNLQIILIDNNSLFPLKDSYLKSLNLNVFHIKNVENKGFAEGNNIGIRQALKMNCDIIALINNDTVFIDNSLTNAVDYLHKNSDIGIIGLINYFYDDPEKIFQAGFISKLDYGKSSTININNYKNKGIASVDYVPGSSIIIRNNVFRRIGLLDPKYFAYFEEYDFCVRAKRKDFKVCVLLESKILHKVGKSSTSVVKLYLRTRNKLLFFKKHASIKGFWQAFIRHIGITILRIVFQERNKRKLFKSMFVGIKDYYSNFFYKGSIDKINKWK